MTYRPQDIIEKAREMIERKIGTREQMYDRIAYLLSHSECEVTRAYIDVRPYNFGIFTECYENENEHIDYHALNYVVELYTWTKKDAHLIENADFKEGNDDALYMIWNQENKTNETFVEWLYNWYPSEYKEHLQNYIYKKLMYENPYDKWVVEIAEKMLRVPQ
ncbi:MAG: hypothetical protein C0179_04285 [Fervidicoccus sp.]|nr:MAG: hypothetical protein C0179_04285 [Fervidicoccus sp.]